MNWPEWGSLVFGMGVGHAVIDVVLQDPRISSMAMRKDPNGFQSLLYYKGHWPYWLLAHGLLNGWAVTIITDRPDLGMAEAVAHIGIDLGKMKGLYSVHVDQAAHWICKGVWAYLTVTGGL